MTKRISNVTGKIERKKINLFESTDDQLIVKVAATVKESCKLLEVGFEYVTGEYNDGGKIFCKRK